MASGQSSYALTQIAHYAEGTQRHAAALLHAHQVGVPAGKLEPWSVEFMRRSVKIWLMTCPQSWVTQLGHSMSVFANHMAEHEFDEGPRADWELLEEHVAAIVTASAERFPEVHFGATKRLPFSDAPPGILRYDKLAGLTTKAGCVRLEAAAINVAEYCRRRVHGDVTSEEIEWLRALHRGQRTAELAADVGYSERDFYRALRRLWEKLGVDGRPQAMGLASRMGWLED